MSFENLADFIQRRMRMSHIYQPVVLMSLLENGGTRHEQDIARDLLSHDQSQIDYYTVIAKNMVGKVLRRRFAQVLQTRVQTASGSPEMVFAVRSCCYSSVA